MTTPQLQPDTAPDDLDVEIVPKSVDIDAADHSAKDRRRDKFAYDFRKLADVRSFLEEYNGLTNFDIESLVGGTANYVYRVTEHGTGTTRIVKHAAPQLASNHAFELSQERMDFEAGMLMNKVKDENECHCSTVGGFNISTVKKTHAHTTHFQSYDQDIKLLCIEDGGNKNLKDAYKDLSLAEIQDIGTELGKWLAHLHGRTPLSYVLGDDEGRNNPIGMAIAGYTYTLLNGTVEKYCDAADAGTVSDKALVDWLKACKDIRKIVEKASRRADQCVGNRISKTREFVCHGDFWPGNILLRSNVSSKSHILTVVDWELTRIGNSATDIGQFAAESTILDLVNDNNHETGLCATFMRAYFKTSAVEVGSKETLYGWMTQIAIHYAVHLVVWPCQSVHWAPPDAVAKLAVHGLSVLHSALSKAPDIRTWGLFDGLDNLEDIAREFMAKRSEFSEE